MRSQRTSSRVLGIAAAGAIAAGGIISLTGAPADAVRAQAGSGRAPAGAVRATVAPIPAVVHIATPSPAVPTRIDRLVKAAGARYREEVHGSAGHQQLRLIAHDPQLRAALRSGDLARLHSYVRSEFKAVWYHRHVSRLRIMRGSRVLVEVGVPFAVAPSQTVLRDAHGRPLATLQVSIQDVIGYVRYMHRNFPVQIVVRGHGRDHVLSSLPAAAAMRLPRHGTVDIGGHRFAVGSFRERAFGGEPVTIWVLSRA